MPIYKRKRNRNFTVIPNDTINDNLSWSARGLLMYLLSKSEDWKVNTADLVNQTKTARVKTATDGVLAIEKELIAKGYMRRIKERGADGKLGKQIIEVCEDPIYSNKDQPEPDKTDAVNKSSPQPYPAQPELAQPELAQPELAQPELAQPELAQPDRANAALNKERVLVSKELTKERDLINKDHVKNVFDYWCEIMEKGKRGKPPILTEARKRMISKRISEFDIDGCKGAIRGCRSSDYHMGANDGKKLYNTIDNIFRSTEKVEMFLGYLEKQPSQHDAFFEGGGYGQGGM